MAFSSAAFARANRWSSILWESARQTAPKSATQMIKLPIETCEKPLVMRLASIPACLCGMVVWCHNLTHLADRLKQKTDHYAKRNFDFIGGWSISIRPCFLRPWACQTVLLCQYLNQYSMLWKIKVGRHPRPELLIESSKGSHLNFSLSVIPCHTSWHQNRIAVVKKNKLNW